MLPLERNHAEQLIAKSESLYNELQIVENIAMNMKKKFEFEFTDESSSNSISFELLDDEIAEEMNVVLENGVPVLHANSQALLILAKTFIKMATCNYEDGFHLHFKKDFDGDEPEVIRCILQK